MAKHRNERINEEVMRATADIVRELKDPRIPVMTSIVRVEVTPDLKFAKVYVSVMGDAAVQADCLKGLKSVAGFIRREVGRRVLLRSTPEFHFVPDNSVEHGAHIAQVLRQLDMERGQPGAARDAGAQEE